MINIFNENFFYLESIVSNKYFNRIDKFCFIYFNQLFKDFNILNCKIETILKIYHFEKYNKCENTAGFIRTDKYNELLLTINKFFIKKASFALVTYIYKFALSCGNIKKNNLPKKFQNIC